MSVITNDPALQARIADEIAGARRDTAEAPRPSRPDPSSDAEPSPPLSGGRVAFLVALWLAVVLATLGLVLYGLEPLFQQRTQTQLLGEYRAKISRSANEAQGLPGIEVPTKAPELGSPIGILEAGAIQLQQVAVEGVAPAQTQMGPGHVAGTAAPGQPGNSAFVGRRSAFGGTFGALDQLTKGERILVSTTQGQVVYTVETVRQQTITTDPVPSASPLGNIPSSTGGTAEAPPDLTAGDTVSVDALYGPTDDDRLTLVTSASASPLNASDATVVIAKLEGTPFTPTPQNGRTDSQTGLAGESGAMAAVLLTILAFAAAVAAAIVLYRRSNPKVAYLLTAAPLLVAMVLLAESLSRLLPSWF